MSTLNAKNWHNVADAPCTVRPEKAKSPFPVFHRAMLNKRWHEQELRMVCHIMHSKDRFTLAAKLCCCVCRFIVPDTNAAQIFLYDPDLYVSLLAQVCFVRIRSSSTS